MNSERTHAEQTEAERTDAGRTGSDAFLELSARERLAVLLDAGEPAVELVGPFDRVRSPWLPLQGLVSQSDDGVVVMRGFIAGQEVVAVAIEAAFEGGSIGEVGGAKIATALEMAESCSRAGRPVAALLLLETGGVRLSEANLGLAGIAGIQTAILRLRRYAPVVAVVAGPVGCFGGMSLAAGLCTTIIGTKHGRVGMNGPEVIEQEAGPDELDAADKELIWSVYGCQARRDAGLIDALVPANSAAIAEAVRSAVQRGPHRSDRLAHTVDRLQALRQEIGTVSKNAAVTMEVQPASVA